MRNTESKTIDLRDQLSKALQAGRFTQALDLYELIEKRKPDEPARVICCAGWDAGPTP
jgi:hypothetical protein